MSEKKLRLGIFPNLDKEKVRIALPEFLDMCRNWGIEPVLPQEHAEEYGAMSFTITDEESLRTLDVAVSLGGDGTLLQMARHLVRVQVPAFGINFGHLGFLAEIDLRGMGKALSRLAQGNYTIENRSLLKATVYDVGGKVVAHEHALNEFVLAKGVFSKLAHVNMSINGKHSGTYAADGVILATATGSTAYSLSSGGPLVMPQLDVTVITPICAHSLVARAVVIPASEVVDLKAVPGSEEMLLSADGENITEVTNDMIVRIEKSMYQMKLVRLTSRDYYQTWQQKLVRSW